MTHDPAPKSAILPGMFRLWVRDLEIPSHWCMAAVGDLESIHLASATIAAHNPDHERLVLPAGDKPCGPPSKCHFCWRPSEVGGRNQHGGLVLLCWRCFSRAKKRLE